jgi:predicted nucleic acid-binding protein
MTVQLDQNIVLDLFLNRAPWAADAATIWQAHVDGRVRAAIAAFTLPTVFYIVRRHAGLATARAAVRACILTLDIAPVDHSTLVLAESLNGRDFEDGRANSEQPSDRFCLLLAIQLRPQFIFGRQTGADQENGGNLRNGSFP